MSDIRSGMKSISGNEPTPAQIARVIGIAHDFDIPKNDAMFPIMVMMDQYHGVFSELPEKMKKAASDAARNAADQSTAAVNAAVAKAVTNLGPQVGAAIVKVAKDINQVDRVKWIGGVVLLVALVFTALGWLTHATGYSSGFETGKAAGYKAAADEKAMVAWANTDQGRLAYELAQAGSLETLAGCNGRGWKLLKGKCSPQPYKEDEKVMVAGWSVGKSAGGTPARQINVSWLKSIFGSET